MSIPFGVDGAQVKLACLVCMESIFSRQQEAVHGDCLKCSSDHCQTILSYDNITYLRPKLPLLALELLLTVVCREPKLRLPFMLWVVRLAMVDGWLFPKRLLLFTLTFVTLTLVVRLFIVLLPLPKVLLPMLPFGAVVWADHVREPLSTLVVGRVEGLSYSFAGFSPYLPAQRK